MKNALHLVLRRKALAPESEFAERLYKKTPRGGEERLMLAILEDAISCLLRYPPAGNRKRDRLVQEARRWVCEEDTGWPFSFQNICWTLGINPSYLRKGLLHAGGNGSNGAGRLTMNPTRRGGGSSHSLRPWKALGKRKGSPPEIKAHGFMRA